MRTVKCAHGRLPFSRRGADGLSTGETRGIAELMPLLLQRRPAEAAHLVRPGSWFWTFFEAATWPHPPPTCRRRLPWARRRAGCVRGGRCGRPSFKRCPDSGRSAAILALHSSAARAGDWLSAVCEAGCGARPSRPSLRVAGECVATVCRGCAGRVHACAAAKMPPANRVDRCRTATQHLPSQHGPQPRREQAGGKLKHRRR